VELEILLNQMIFVEALLIRDGATREPIPQSKHRPVGSTSSFFRKWMSQNWSHRVANIDLY